MSVIYNITFTPTPGTTTRIDYRLESELDWITPSSPANPTSLYYYSLTLEEGNTYYIRTTSIASDGECANASTIIVVNIATADDCPLITSITGEYTTSTTTSTTSTSTTTLPPSTLIAYWGWKSTNAVLSDTAIEASPNFQTVTTTQDIVCTFAGGSATPQYLWMAEPLVCSPKTKWQDTIVVLNNGNIGTGDDLFNAPTESAAYRFYITVYLTQQTDPIKFEVI